jgi:hypothetical protein
MYSVVSTSFSLQRLVFLVFGAEDSVLTVDYIFLIF